MTVSSNDGAISVRDAANTEQAGLPNAARRWAARRASMLVGQRFACTAAGAALLVTRASTHIYLPFIEKA
jgi:hypothetical protein